MAAPRVSVGKSAGMERFPQARRSDMRTQRARERKTRGRDEGWEEAFIAMPYTEKRGEDIP